MGFDSELVQLIENHTLVNMFRIINYISSSLYHSLVSDTLAAAHRFLQVSLGVSIQHRALTLWGGLYWNTACRQWPHTDGSSADSTYGNVLQSPAGLGTMAPGSLHSMPSSAGRRQNNNNMYQFYFGPTSAEFVPTVGLSRCQCLAIDCKKGFIPQPVLITHSCLTVLHDIYIDCIRTFSGSAKLARGITTSGLYLQNKNARVRVRQT